MFKCNKCGHQWTSGEKCPHCGGTDFEELESVATKEVASESEPKTPEPEPPKSTDKDQEEDEESEEE